MLLFKKCPFVVVVTMITIMTMRTTNKGQFLNNKTVIISMVAMSRKNMRTSTLTIATRMTATVLEHKCVMVKDVC